MMMLHSVSSLNALACTSAHAACEAPQLEVAARRLRLYSHLLLCLGCVTPGMKSSGFTWRSSGCGRAWI